MKYLIITFLLILTACTDGIEHTLKCDSNDIHYSDCNPLIIRQLYQACKDNNMKPKEYVYTDTKETVLLYCDATETIDGEDYFNTLIQSRVDNNE